MASFGKDPANLPSTGNFGHDARFNEANKPRPQGGGGGKPTWIDNFKPSTAEADVVRVLKGQYEVDVAVGDNNTVQVVKKTLTYYPWTEHFHGGLRKGCTCSAGPLAMFKDKRQPCRACDIFWANKSKGKKNPMSRREMYSFSVLHYAPYTLMEQVDKDGKIRCNDEGEPYMNWVRRTKFEVQQDQAGGREVRDAHLLHWDIGYGHWGTLLEYDKEFGKSCRSCGGRDTIQMEAWTCPHCGEALIEPNSTYTQAEIDEITNKEVRCAHCQQVGRLTEYVSCTNCANGRRADIFDVDMGVKRVADAKGGNQTTLMVTSWSNPRPIDARFTELAKPLNLSKVFVPTPMEVQEELFGAGAPNPGARQPVTTVGGHSRPFNS
jgi:predicted RNA-binding Zn-ribbon protein involved in translation (DUF1610 family)